MQIYLHHLYELSGIGIGMRFSAKKSGLNFEEWGISLQVDDIWWLTLAPSVVSIFMLVVS